MNCICSEIDNTKFSKTIEEELRVNISLEDIIYTSDCISISIDDDENPYPLTVNETLSVFKKKEGIYILWIKEEYCSYHNDDAKMLAIYVGKGVVENRLKVHVKTKFPKSETIYVSFFECSNRISKYIEQLFLDIYDFYLNANENKGTEYLKAIWDQPQLTNGTKTHEFANILAKKYPEYFNPDPLDC